MEIYDFKNAMKRVFEAAECRTQTELAEFLSIRQSSISDAKRRESIPAEWIVKLLEKKRINPNWLLRGQEAKHLAPVDNLDHVEPVVHIITRILPPESYTVQELINELVKRALDQSESEG